MRRSIVLAGLALLAGPARADDAAAAGKTRFVASCGLCHSAEPADGLGGMGPNLHDLIGRPAATADPDFPYTKELRGSKLVWTPETLSRFLSGPGKLVPGTAMQIVVEDQAARDQLIAYFQSLKQPHGGH